MTDIQKEFVYEVKFGCCDGRQGLYKANTVKEIHNKINEDTALRDFEKDMLKYGYFGEFIGKDYKTSDYVIDNGFHCMWKVNRENRKIKSILNKLMKGVFK